MDSPWINAWKGLGASLTQGRPESFGNAAAELDSLHHGLALRDRGRSAVLRISGADRIDLLHRISAVDFNGALPGSCIPALFTNEKGRILDLAWAAIADSEVLLLCGEGHGELLRSWIEKYTITEDVNSILAPEAATLSVVGDGAAEAIGRALGIAPVRPGQFVSMGKAFWVLAESSARRPIVHVSVMDPPDRSDFLEALLSQELRPVGETAHTQWCIETGRLRAGLDLDDSLNPLEAGLYDIIAWTKGCYIGQEVVARLDTYDKVRRRPALLSSPGAASAKGSKLLLAGQSVGWVISAIARTGARGSVALAVISREIEQNAALQTEDGVAWRVERFAAGLSSA